MLAGVLLLLALAHAPPPPPPRAGAEVRLEARAILVPALPHSVAEARKHYARVRKELDLTYREAEAYLTACSAELAAQGQPEGQITLPAAFAPEAKMLGRFLYDETYLALEDPLLDRWNTWQNRLLEAGMAQPAEAQRMADGMLLLSSSKTEVASRAVSPGQPPLEILWEDPASAEITRLTLPRRVTFIEVLAVDRMPYNANTAWGQQASTFADAQGAQLEAAWQPLVEHLNREAAALLDLDRTAPPTQHRGLRALRLLARVNFMERFRSTLWFCQVVWAHMASERILPIRQM